MFRVLALCSLEDIISGRSYTVTSGDFSILDCSFQRFGTFVGNGGVMYCVGAKNSNISNCIFYNISVSGEGGAIYCDGGNGNVCINGVCAEICSCTERGHFAFIKNDNDDKHDLNRISVCMCAPSENIGISSIYLCFGIQIVKSSNFSKNKAKLISTIYNDWSAFYTGTYLTFVENQTPSACHYSYGNGASRTIGECNFIKNTSPSNTGIIAINFGELSVTNVVLTKNNDTLFYSGSSMIVTSCFIDHQFTVFTGIITQSNNSLSQAPTHHLVHVYPNGCFATFIQATSNHVYSWKCSFLLFSYVM